MRDTRARPRRQFTRNRINVDTHDGAGVDTNPDVRLKAAIRDITARQARKTHDDSIMIPDQPKRKRRHNTRQTTRPSLKQHTTAKLESVNLDGATNTTIDHEHDMTVDSPDDPSDHDDEENQTLKSRLISLGMKGGGKNCDPARKLKLKMEKELKKSHIGHGISTSRTPPMAIDGFA